MIDTDPETETDTDPDPDPDSLAIRILPTFALGILDMAVTHDRSGGTLISVREDAYGRRIVRRMNEMRTGQGHP